MTHQSQCWVDCCDSDGVAGKLLVTPAEEGLLVRLPAGEAVTLDRDQAEQLHFAVVHGIDEAAERSGSVVAAVPGYEQVAVLTGAVREGQLPAPARERLARLIAQLNVVIRLKRGAAGGEERQVLIATVWPMVMATFDELLEGR